jgi:hypothetical protein
MYPQLPFACVCNLCPAGAEGRQLSMAGLARCLHPHVGVPRGSATLTRAAQHACRSGVVSAERGTLLRVRAEHGQGRGCGAAQRRGHRAGHIRHAMCAPLPIATSCVMHGVQPAPLLNLGGERLIIDRFVKSSCWISESCVRRCHTIRFLLLSSP